MTIPFHPLDVEAAAKAYDATELLILNGELRGNIELEPIKAALTAFLSSAKARGAAREGFDVEYISTSRTSPVREIKFKTLIIRMEE